MGVSVAHHGDQHVQQQNRHEDHEDHKDRLGQIGVGGVIKIGIVIVAKGSLEQGHPGAGITGEEGRSHLEKID